MSGTSAMFVDRARGPLKGRVRVPGDKSIAHRAVMFNGAARGEAIVEGLPSGRDVASTVAAMRRLGVAVGVTGPATVRVVGKAMRFVRQPPEIDCENSGTTMRLLAGLLAGQAELTATLTGDESLSRRPMKRVAEPLAALGAKVTPTEGHAPLYIHGRSLRAAEIRLPVASAQVKSAVLLAGLQADGRTTVHEPTPTRDHTEKLLAAMGAPISAVLSRGAAAGAVTSVVGRTVPECVDVKVPGDPSSAAFLVVAATLVEGSDLTIDGVCLNPTRLGFLEVLRRMGANVEATIEGDSGGEPVGSIRVRASSLRAFTIGAAEVPAAIDELPLLAIAAGFAEGETVISGASELRVKESDRIATTAAMLRGFGIEVEEKDDGLVVCGGRPVGGATVATRHDHRIAMSAAVAALAAGGGGVHLDDADPIGVSFPEFFQTLASAGA